MDFEEEGFRSSTGCAATMRKRRWNALQDSSMVVLSDYGKGVCSAEWGEGNHP